MIGLNGLLLLILGFVQTMGLEIPGDNVPGFFRMLFGVLQMLLAKGLLERAWGIALALQAVDLVSSLYYYARLRRRSRRDRTDQLRCAVVRALHVPHRLDAVPYRADGGFGPAACPY